MKEQLTEGHLFGHTPKAGPYLSEPPYAETETIDSTPAHSETQGNKGNGLLSLQNSAIVCKMPRHAPYIG